MGSDDLFKLRKKKREADLRREEKKREPYDLVLIVCEGGKTEPKYLEALRDRFRLSTANIKIVGDACGSSPRNVVDYAISEYKREYKNQKKYNRVYCVFDKDRHPAFNEALAKVRDAKLLRKEDSIHAITSVPCFEIWLLLHFTYTTKSFTSSGASGSICASVIKELKRYLQDYAKGADNLFGILFEKLPDALKHAKQLAEHGAASGSDNPSTRMHELVAYLRDMKENGRK